MSKLSVRFTTIARIDFREGMERYESLQTGLGLRFGREVGIAVMAAAERPRSFPIQFLDIRRVIVNDFPYGVFFAVEPQRIVVTSIVDLRSDPKGWPRRNRR